MTFVETRLTDLKLAWSQRVPRLKLNENPPQNLGQELKDQGEFYGTRKIQP